MSELKRYRDLLKRRQIRHWFSIGVGTSMWFTASNQLKIGRFVNHIDNRSTVTTYSFGPFQLYHLSLDDE